jgi:hypothetical protein
VSVRTTVTYRRVALWGSLVARLVGAWGLGWDIQWHMTIGRDSFWIAPHVMIYSSVVTGLVLAWGVLAYEWLTGIATTRGFRLAGLGLVLVVLAAPLDDLWHRLFGLDVTLWSPPHLLALFGSAVSTLGCLLIAIEVSRCRAGRDAPRSCWPARCSTAVSASPWTRRGSSPTRTVASCSTPSRCSRL